MIINLYSNAKKNFDPSFSFQGELNRSIAEHSLNSHSSRSHCIFTLYIESKSRTLSSAKYTVSKLTFVDLAGSERLSKTEVCMLDKTEGSNTLRLVLQFSTEQVILELGGIVD